jgi:putative membrane protein
VIRRKVSAVTVVETLLRSWRFAPVPLLGLVVLTVGYLAAARRVNGMHPAIPWQRARTAAFLGGSLAAAVAVLGPPGYFDDTFFYAHMVQHILLTMVAAPLLVLGDPVLLVLRATPRSFRQRRLVPVLRSRPVHALTNPVTGWLLFTVVMVGSHLPAAYDYALAHPLVHDYVEHPLYLSSALIFFYPLLSPTSGPRQVLPGVRILSLLTMMIPTTFTGFFIYVLPHVAYPFYAHTDRPFGPAPLADQQLSGALMWSSSMILSVIWLCFAGLHWIRAEERRARRVDRAGPSVGAAAEAPRPGWSS